MVLLHTKHNYVCFCSVKIEVCTRAAVSPVQSIFCVCVCMRENACACVRNLSPNNDTDQWMTSATNACHCKTLILCNTPRQMASLLTYLLSLVVYTALFITVQSAICHSTAKTVTVSFVCRTFSVLEMRGLLSALLLLAIVSVCQVKLNTWINYRVSVNGRMSNGISFNCHHTLWSCHLLLLS